MIIIFFFFFDRCWYQVSTCLFFYLSLSMVSGQLDFSALPNQYGRGNREDLDAKNILARLDFTGAERCSANVAAQWAYETNVNEYSQNDAVSSNNNQ